MKSHLSSDFRLSSGPIPFENRALLNAVRHISNNLVRRASINTRDRRYANLLSNILGESHYATIETLAQKRRESTNLGRKRREAPGLPSSSDEGVSEPSSKKLTQHDLRKAPSAATRDKLVKLLRAVRHDELAAKERTLTMTFLKHPGARNVDSLRRLWGVPKVVFEATRLDRYLTEQDAKVVETFYDRYIWRNCPDARIFNILYWKESCFDQKHDALNDPCHKPERLAYYSPRKPPDHRRMFRTVSKSAIAKVIRTLMTRRRSPFFEKNMDIAVETVLYAINPDRLVERFRESALREAEFFKGLHGYEYSRSFTGSLENLHMGKLNRLVKDIRAVRSFDTADRSNSSRNGTSSCMSLRAIRKYCAERDSLTDRVLHGVHGRYVQQRTRRSNSGADDVRFTVADFVRMYLAWVGCWTDPGVKYWFSILDQDGDGVVGVGDVAHFYSERKVESERRNGIILTDVGCVWFRLCAMSGVSPNGPGLDLNAFKEMGKEEREFVMYALLFRRADDASLTNVAATMASTMAANGNDAEGAIVL